jgi:hypothetical protein
MSLLSGQNERTAFPEKIYTTLTKSQQSYVQIQYIELRQKRIANEGKSDTNLHALKYSMASTAHISEKIMISQRTTVDKPCVLCTRKNAEVGGQISFQSLKYTTAFTVPISPKIITVSPIYRRSADRFS